MPMLIADVRSLIADLNKLTKPLGLDGHLREQLGRAASSISLNLAEGYGRASQKERKRFFVIAMGSLRECQAILTLGEHQHSEAYTVLNQTGASLYKLLQKFP